jgi:hypothetical protein
MGLVFVLENVHLTRQDVEVDCYMSWVLIPCFL